MKIYHNPRCSKSRQTLKLITDAGIEPEIALYMDKGLSVVILKNLIVALGFDSPKDLVRKGEKIYKELGLRDVDDDNLLKALSKHPKLIERPIVVKGGKAILGRPPENVTPFLTYD